LRGRTAARRKPPQAGRLTERSLLPALRDVLASRFILAAILGAHIYFTG
jgi:hypothetical protein